jgi:methyl-accepting chemotaxis protein
MSLSQRIVFIAALLTLVAAGVFSYIGHLERQHLEQGMAEPVNTGRRYAWEWALDSQLKRMHDHVAALESDFGLKTAFKEADAAAIKQHADTLYALLQEQGAFDTLQLVDKAGQLLYSQPKPAEIGSPTQKAFVLNAIESGKLSSALTRDDDGELVLGLAIPIKSRRGAYGAGVYLVDMQRLAQLMLDKDGSAVALLDVAGKLQAETRAGLYASLGARLPAPGEISLQTRSQGGKTYSVAIQGLADAAGDPLGHLVSMQDISAHYQQTQRMTQILVLISVASLALIIAVFWLYIRRALRPLVQAVDQLARLAQGDLRIGGPSVPGQDEIGRLNQALATTAGHLRDLVGNITASATDQVAHSVQLAALSQESLDKAQQQQRRVLQIASASSQMSIASQDLSASIQQISQYSSQTLQIARSGGGQVKQAIANIQEVAREIGQLADRVQHLRNSSASITQIVGVIKGISEQTNLLALNAAIEAARAGEAGRGFAVVADEVRHLSQHTHKSVTEIEAVINSIQQQTGEVGAAMESSQRRTASSSSLSEQSLSALGQIEERIKALQEYIDAGAAAAEQMAATASSVQEDVEAVSQIAEQVSGDARQVSQSSADLQQLAEGLNQQMGFFKTAASESVV